MSDTTTAAKKALTKGQLQVKLAEDSGLTVKQVKAVLDALLSNGLDQVKKVGSFTVPGLVKLTTVTKPAVAGGKEVPNPFKKGEMMITKDKPARTVVKARVLKGVKDAVA